MNESRILFLDLEDTIITPVLEGWWNTELINLNKIRNFIKIFNPSSLHIFSFAIHNEQDYRNFVNSGTKGMIENALDMHIVRTPTVEDIIVETSEQMLIHPSTVPFNDLVQMWGKQLSFPMYIRTNFVNAKNDVSVALLDDTVFDQEFSFKTNSDDRIFGSILNIDKLS